MSFGQLIQLVRMRKLLLSFLRPSNDAPLEFRLRRGGLNTYYIKDTYSITTSSSCHSHKDTNHSKTLIRMTSHISSRFKFYLRKKKPMRLEPAGKSIKWQNSNYKLLTLCSIQS